MLSSLVNQFGLPGGMEWIWIILILVILFGASRIPKVARSIGEAVREFRKGMSSLEEEVEKPEEERVEPETALIEAAKKLGIETEGKSMEQLSKEILKKTKEKKE